ncbi:MAG TPA: hypothetical protein VHP11_04290 [Tepidisphaeraceae bacterium]|nr:hypothetical protein [Tepidisphaeraceae bacterium]
MPSGPEKPDAGQNPPSNPTPTPDVLQRVAQQVIAKLNEGRNKDAVRLFVEAYNRGVLAKGHQLPVWLLGTLGKEVAAKLFLAFAHFPCVYCKGGLEPCESCGGRGVRAEGPFCDTCAALGQSRCEFCDGTGLATYSFFPPELWLPVIVDRSRLAIHQVSYLVGHPVPVDGPEPRLTELIINLNKLLGVLENAVLAAKQIAHHNTHAHTIVHTVNSCNHAAAVAIKYLRQVIRSLAAVVRDGAKTQPSDSAEAQFRTGRAAFYETLADSNRFEGTCLYHPFLDSPSSPPPA